MYSLSVKDRSLRAIDQLPDEATWDDVLDAVLACQAIEAGLDDAQAGRLISTGEVRRRLLITGECGA